MSDTNMTVRRRDGKVVGWVRNFGCDNTHCTTAVVNGKRWHATPSQEGVTMPEYHFRDLEQAITELHRAWKS
jgi:hypothetical protein